MEKMIEMAMKALESSTVNEIELTDATGLRVRLIKNAPVIWYYQPAPIYPSPYTVQFHSP